jgi:hypothetical protein
MESIVIRVKDRQKADLLMQFLKALDFVEQVSAVDQEANESDVAGADAAEFYALAGVWKGREVTLESLRQKAWPRQL